jgi:hypothetical protein
MRILGLLVALTLVVVGCSSKTDASAPDPAALKAQKELVERRDALMAQRKKLEGERDQIDEEIKKVTATGGDTSELTKKREQIDSQIQSSGSDLTSLTSKLDQVVAQGDAAAGIAGREGAMATREKAVAVREGQFAERERQLAAREATLAQREKDTCGNAAPVIMQIPAPAKGGNYTRKDIEPLLGKARQQMAKKGLLPGDLGPAANLEGEATAAMKADDWGKAYLAAAQLAATVDAIKVDRNFVAAKAMRLQKIVQSTKRDEAVQKQLADGLTDVMQKFGDGDHAAANRKLNALWALVK